MKEPSCSKNMEKEAAVVVCMNEACGVALPSPADCAKGWPLRSAGFATLCRKCGAAYEQLVFCELFHTQDSGWRECILCSKRLHCGCAASTSLLELLDSGGVICISCSENRELCSNSGLGNNKDADVYAVGENQLTSSANQSNIGTIEKMNLVQCGEADDVTESLGQRNTGENLLPSPGDFGSPLLSFLNPPAFEVKQSEKPSEPKENALIQDVHESLLQTNLTISLSVTSGNTNLSHAAVVEERSAGVNIPSISLGSKSRHPLPRPLKSIMAAGLETNAGTVSQLRVARPPVEGRIKNQLLPRYWPRITDQELQKIAGDVYCSSKSTVVPLFEKVLSASDAGRIGRLVLPKACAEAYFPPISQPEGLPLRIQDIKGKEWVFQFRFWPNNNSRMYVLEGVTPCIQSMQLQAGDTVTFSRMDPEGKLLMGFRKASNSIFMQDNKHPSSTQKGSFSIDPMVMPVNGQPGCHQLLKGGSALPRQFSSGDFGCHVGEMNDWKPLSGPASSHLPVLECKKSRNIGSKSKRLLMDNDDALELKLSWEELQNMLCPPPSVEPTAVTIEDYEFEEYDEPPVFLKKSIFTIRPSGEQEQWAQCDSCLKWRSLPVHVILPPRWRCEDNTWSNSRPSCSVKDDLSPEELENLLRMSIGESVSPSLSFIDSQERCDIPSFGAELKKQRTAAGLESGQVLESSKPDGSRTANGDDTSEMDPASVKTTTKHPRHRPGCSCIVCIQPPSGKGKHKPTCTCNVCMTVKRRFKTLMMRRKKRQSEREAEVAQRSHLKEEAEVESFEPPLGDYRRSQSTGKQPEKGQLDLNYHPDVELNSSRVSMIKLVREASLPLDNYLKQKGLSSLVSDQQEAARESQERCAGDEDVQVQEGIKDELAADGSDTS